MQLRGNPTCMTIWSVYIEQQVTVASISNVKCPLYETKTNIPRFPRSTPGLLFHSPGNQSLVSSLVIQQPLGWHLTMIPPGSCSLATVLWYRIMYSGILPLHTYIANMTVKCIFFITPCLNHRRICAAVINSTKRWHIKIQWCFISTSYLAQR